MDLFERLADAIRPEVNWRDQLGRGVKFYAKCKYREEMNSIHNPVFYVLPKTKEGEAERKRLYEVCTIDEFGAFEREFTYEGREYLAIIEVNG